MLLLTRCCSGLSMSMVSSHTLLLTCPIVNPGRTALSLQLLREVHFVVVVVSGLLCRRPAAPMLDALAAGLRECSRKPITGERLHFLDGFLNNMLRSRISRRVLAEQHLMLDVPRYVHTVPHLDGLALGRMSEP